MIAVVITFSRHEQALTQGGEAASSDPGDSAEASNAIQEEMGSVRAGSELSRLAATDAAFTRSW
jgi:hypothetical protein